jgi:hypothetical protein
MEPANWNVRRRKGMSLDNVKYMVDDGLRWRLGRSHVKLSDRVYETVNRVNKLRGIVHFTQDGAFRPDRLNSVFFSAFR